MSTAIATEKTVKNNGFEAKISQKSPRRLLTLDEFYRRYSSRRDGFKYEFNRGLVEKTLRTMTFEQAFIAFNIIRKFNLTKAYAEGCMLWTEFDQKTSRDQVRRPDFTFSTPEKIRKNDSWVSEFVIEVVSGTDRSEDVIRKMEEYFSAGVRVAWYVFPQARRVEVYTSPIDVKICKGSATVSAAPVVPDFEMTVDEIFQQ